MKKFFENSIKSGLVIGLVIGIILSGIFGVLIENTRLPQERIDDLYKKEMLVAEDFNNAYKLENVQININENIEVVFLGEDCNLKVVYDKDTKYVLHKEFNDTTVKVLSFTFFMVALFACFDCVLFSIYSITIIKTIIGKVKAKKENKTKEQIVDEKYK